MLAAEMQKSTDKVMVAVSVVISSACPAAAVGKMLKHQIEELHCFRNFRFGHGRGCSDPDEKVSLSPASAIRSGQSHWLDQRRIVVPDIADSRADRPCNHAVGRVGDKQLLRAVPLRDDYAQGL